MQHGGRKILVIDLGGTNLRAAFGNPEDNELSDVQKIKLDCINAVSYTHLTLPTILLV